MATIAMQKRMNLEMNSLQVKSDWHTRQVAPHPFFDFRSPLRSDDI